MDYLVLVGVDSEGDVFVADPGQECFRQVTGIVHQHGGECGKGLLLLTCCC